MCNEGNKVNERLEQLLLEVLNGEPFTRDSLHEEVHLIVDGKQRNTHISLVLRTLLMDIEPDSEVLVTLKRENRHLLKILPKYFEPVQSNDKTFEVRKDDRDYKVGDILILREWSPEEGYTGRYCTRRITYILGRETGEEYYCKEGYVTIGMHQKFSNYLEQVCIQVILNNA